VIAAISGTTSKVCAMTIASGVYSSPKPPNGPERDSSRYTTTPTTTEGRPIMPLISTDSVLLPGKRPTAMQAPSGRPISVPSTTAPPLTCSDSTTISATVWSKVASSDMASEKVAAKADIGREHNRKAAPAGTPDAVSARRRRGARALEAGAKSARG